MMRPTTRTVVILAVGVPLTLLVVIYEPALWVLAVSYVALVLLLVIVDLLLTLPPGQLTSEVVLPEKLQIAGRDGAIRLKLTAPDWQRTTRLEAIAELQGEVEAPQIVSGDLPAGGATEIALPLVPRRRGRIAVERVWLRWRGPLRLIERMIQRPVGGSVDVLPNVRGVRSPALQFFAQEAIYGIKSQQQAGEGVEFDALREFAPGLDSRFIDWKHSARHRRLLCKEFRTERNHQIVMAFDTGYLMLEPIDQITRLDHAINAGLMLTWISLQGGDLVGTFGFDAAVRHYQVPLRGVSSFPRIERATAEIAYHLDETNFTLGLAELNVRLKRRALVILFTDFVDTISAELLIESLQRLANRHVVLFVTQRGSVLQQALDAPPRELTDVARAVIAHDFLREREIVLERLQRLGVHCLDVPSRGLSVALVNRYLTIKQRGLI
ncbi:MAG: DUF58 domain-containing protein [Hyphomicrobiales bacterium]|nr:DUF58 domain-containing protein [Hyphomicrobiales bacterium]